MNCKKKYFLSFILTSYFTLLIANKIYTPILEDNKNTIQKVINVKDFGAKGDSITDDSKSFEAALNNINTTSSKLIIPKGNYHLSHPITIKNYGDLEIIGENSTLTFNLGKSNSQSFINLKGKSQTSTTKINGITVNGIKTNNNQWDLQIWNKSLIYDGIVFTNGVIDISNVKIANIWGNGMKFFNTVTTSIRNVEVTNVGGHWYKNNEFDAFGDAIYIGDRSFDSKFTIDSLNAEGKVSTNGKLSRIGITVESLKNKIPTNTTVIISNSTLKNYERTIHSEGNLGFTNFEISNSSLMGSVVFFSYNDQNISTAKIANSTIAFYSGDYNGTFGLSRSFKVNMENSIINDTGNGQAMGDSGSIGVYKNCTFNSMKGTFATNSKLEIYDSKIIIDPSKKGNLFWNSDTRFYNSSFIASENSPYIFPLITKNIPIFDQCKFYNIKLLIPKKYYLNSSMIN